MKSTDFLSMSSYIRVQEKHLLSGAELERIADVDSITEAMRLIGQNSDYDFSMLKRPDEYEIAVSAERQRVIRMLYELCRKFPAVPEVLGCKYDYHNVKIAIKAESLNQRYGVPYIHATPVNVEKIAKTAEKFDPKADLPAHLLSAIQSGLQVLYASGNPQEMDIEIDKQMYDYMLRQAKETQSAWIIGYVQQCIDLYNLKTLVRVKSMGKGSSFLANCLAQGGKTDSRLFLEAYGKNRNALAATFAFKDYSEVVKAGIEIYERERTYAALERLADNSMMEYIQSAKRISFGPEVPFAYFAAKENEIRQVRILLACKQNQIPNEILKERLRDNYV